MFKRHLAPLLAAGICLWGIAESDGATSMIGIPSGDWTSSSGFNEAHGDGMVGWVFTVKQTITVTQVGWYDGAGDGLSRSFQVGLWQDLSGGNFSPNAPLVQLLGVASSGIVIPSGTSAALNGVWRVVDLPSSLVLQPGSYQLAGLDTASTTDQIRYISQNYKIEDLSNANVNTGQFFYAAMGPTSSGSNPGFHATYNFYLAGGLELGPMLFTVSEPSSYLLIGVSGVLFLRRRDRRLNTWNCGSAH